MSKNLPSHSMWSYNVKENTYRPSAIFILSIGPFAEQLVPKIAMGRMYAMVCIVTIIMLFGRETDRKSTIAGCARGIRFCDHRPAKPPEKNPAARRTIIPSNLFRLVPTYIYFHRISTRRRLRDRRVNKSLHSRRLFPIPLGGDHRIYERIICLRNDDITHAGRAGLYNNTFTRGKRQRSGFFLSSRSRRKSRHACAPPISHTLLLLL